MAAMRLPRWLKLVWTLWVVAWAPLYWKHYGAQNFFYFCDLGNLLIAVALWLESPLIFSWQATGLLLFQSLYTIDLLGAVLSNRHLIGGTEYMFDSGLPLYLRLLSLFHVVTPPLLLWAVWRLGYDRRGWKYQTLTTWAVVPINYFWRPQYDINWARGPFFREQHIVSVGRAAGRVLSHSSVVAVVDNKFESQNPLRVQPRGRVASAFIGVSR
jgi:hypothetical protein